MIERIVSAIVGDLQIFPYRISDAMSFCVPAEKWYD